MRILFAFLLLPFASCMLGKEDQRTFVREKICEAFSKNGIDPVPACEFFDSLNHVYGVRKIVVSKKNVINHFFYPSRVMLLNGTDSTHYLDNWMGEIAHAKGFSERPNFFAPKAAGEIISTFFRSITKRGKYEAAAQALAVKRGWKFTHALFWVVYEEQYKKLSSFEYMTHSIEEPMLWSLLAKRYMKKNVSEVVFASQSALP